MGICLPVSCIIYGAPMVINDGIKSIGALESISEAGQSIERQSAPKGKRDITIKVNDKSHGVNPNNEALDNVYIQHNIDTGIQFEIEDTLHIVVAKIIEKDSGDVIRQIPPDEMIKISKAIKDMESKAGDGSHIDTEA